MARSSAYHRLLFLVLLTGFFFSVTFAEIRVYDMNSNIFNNDSILFIDSFQFTNGGKGGRIEINVSDIYLSNSNLNLNFSTVGFFLFTRYDDYSVIEKSIAGFSFHKLINGTKNFDFVFFNEDKEEKQQQELYSLYFINYLSNKEFQFSMVVKSSMYDLEFDKRNYLSRTKVLLPRIHFVFLMIYMCLIFFSLWNIRVYYIKLKGNQLLRIHIAILVVLIIKVLSHLTGLVRNIFIKHFGYSQGFFVTTLAYGGVVFSEVPFAILLTLVSCGWSYLKPSLNFKQKIILIFVIIFHSAMNVDVLKYTQIRPNCESCPSCLSYWWFSRALFDVAVLSYCVHSSYYFLLDSGDVEGKALPTLVKIKKLWKFFYLCWSFHSVKFFCLLFQYDPNLWETVLFGEAITFGLFVFVEYMFWSDIPSLKLRIDDDLENAAAKILNREYNISLF